MNQPSSTLSRRLGLWDAIAIGVASMVGAGVFAVWRFWVYAIAFLLASVSVLCIIVVSVLRSRADRH